MRKTKRIISLILSVALVLSFSIVLASAETITVATAEDFYEAIEDGKSVKLGADIGMYRTAYLDTGDVTIDLNGHNIYTIDGEFEPGELEIENPTEAEEAFANYSNYYYFLFVIDGANVTITDTSSNPGSIEAEINGARSDIFGVISGTLNVSNVTLNQVTGLQEEEINPSYSPYGSIVVAFGGTLSFDNITTADCYYYALLSLDVNATFSNCDITCCNTIFYPSNVFSGSLTVNNCEAECDIAFQTRGCSGTITVNGGTFTSYDDTIYSRGGNYILNNCTFIENNYDTIYCDSYYGESNITINGGTFKATSNAIDCEGGNVTINGGEFTADDYCCIYISNYYNANGENATFTINDGSFTNSEDNEHAVLYVDNYDETANNYNDPSLDPYEYIDVIIKDGEFKSYDYYGIEGCGNLTIYNANVTSADVAVNWWGDYLRIYDGTFDGGYSGLWFDYEADVELFGGTYIGHAVGSDPSTGGISIYYPDDTTDIKDFVAEGYTIYDTDETHKVSVDGWSYDYRCTEDKVVIAPLKAEILKGDASYTKGSKTSVVVSSNISLSLFDSVLVDGEEVADDNYEATSGSTIITFKPAYLESLSVGKHEVTIVSKAASKELKATTTLTIVAAPVEETTETEEVAQTGDNNMIGAFVAMGVFAAAGYALVKKHED